ncbi:MAG: hypothetical protein Q4C68_01970 [Moraxella sp.]|nr:hypothetical protein [Moraxella sp.]
MEFEHVLTIVISALSLLVAYMVFATNNRPKIIIFAKMHTDKKTIINLVVKNVGREIAYDVRFDSDRLIPKSAFGLTKLDNPNCYFDSGIFEYGVKVFNPDQEFIFEWGQFYGLMEALDEKPIMIKVDYKYKNPLKPWYSNGADKSVIDIREMSGLPVNYGSVRVELKQLTEELVKIRNTLDKIKEKL